MNTETLYTMLKSALFAGRSSVLNAARQDCFNLYKMASSRQDKEMLITLDTLFHQDLQRFIDSKNIDAFYDMESKKAYMELSRNNAREAALAATKTYAEQYLKYLDDNDVMLLRQHIENHAYPIYKGLIAMGEQYKANILLIHHPKDIYLTAKHYGAIDIANKVLNENAYEIYSQTCRTCTTEQLQELNIQIRGHSTTICKRALDNGDTFVVDAIAQRYALDIYRSLKDNRLTKFANRHYERIYLEAVVMNDSKIVFSILTSHAYEIYSTLYQKGTDEQKATLLRHIKPFAGMVYTTALRNDKKHIAEQIIHEYRLEVLQYLIDTGDKTNAQRVINQHGIELCLSAARNNYPKIVEELIEKRGYEIYAYYAKTDNVSALDDLDDYIGPWRTEFYITAMQRQDAKVAKALAVGGADIYDDLWKNKQTKLLQELAKHHHTSIYLHAIKTDNSHVLHDILDKYGYEIGEYVFSLNSKARIENYLLHIKKHSGIVYQHAIAVQNHNFADRLVAKHPCYIYRTLSSTLSADELTRFTDLHYVKIYQNACDEYDEDIKQKILNQYAYEIYCYAILHNEVNLQMELERGDSAHHYTILKKGLLNNNTNVIKNILVPDRAGAIDMMAIQRQDKDVLRAVRKQLVTPILNDEIIDDRKTAYKEFDKSVNPSDSVSIYPETHVLPGYNGGQNDPAFYERN